MIFLLAFSRTMIGEADEGRLLRVDGFVLLFFAILGTALLCTRILRPGWGRKERGRPPVSGFRPVHLIWAGLDSLFCFWVVEYVNNEKLMEIAPKFVLANVACILVIILILFLWLNSLRASMVFITGLWTFAALLFYTIYDMRGEPLQLIDFTSMQTAFTVSDSYIIPFPRTFVAAIVLGACIAAILIHLPRISAARTRRRKILIRVIAAAVMIAGGFFYMNTSWNRALGITTDLFAPIKTYRKYGTTLGFFCVGKYMRLRSPEGYSLRETEEIAERSAAQDVLDHTTDVIPSNIIVIMNEAWADYSYAGYLDVNTDPLQYYHSLEDNTIKGYNLVCITGGGTAKTEYEFLTGNSVKRFPGMVPYVSYFTHDQYSLVTTLQSQGYRAIAMHPYKASNWNRPSAYKLMNFEDFITEEAFDEDAKRIRGFISDQANYEKIIDVVKEKEDPDDPLFIFNITMQNHGGYSKSKYSGDVYCENYAGDEKDEATFNRFLSLMKETDMALRYLIEYFRGLDEPTLIVMFGDHYPNVPDSVTETISGKKFDELSFPEQQRYYATPFLIWANYDIPEEENVVTSTNFLGTMMLQQTGLEGAPYNAYLSELMKEIPALNHLGYRTADGDDVSWDNAEEPYLTREWEYECLQYNELAKKRERLDWFFTAGPEED